MIQPRTNQAGFSAGAIVAAVLVLAVIGGVGIIVFKKSSDKSAATTTSTPDAKDNVADPGSEPKQPVGYAGFTQYTNEKYGLSFYYPEEWRVEERDPTLTVDPEKTELSLWLVDKNAKERTAAGIISVVNRDLESVAAGIDGFASAHGGSTAENKQALTLKGKEAIKYTFPQTENNRYFYYFAVGNKTYQIETILEDVNVKRTPDYMAKFDKIVESLRLP